MSWPRLLYNMVGEHWKTFHPSPIPISKLPTVRNFLCDGMHFETDLCHNGVPILTLVWVHFLYKSIIAHTYLETLFIKGHVTLYTGDT